MMKRIFAVAVLFASTLTAAAQTKVTRQYATPTARFATYIWAGDTLYVAGQMAAPLTAANKTTGAAATWGDTEQQATYIFSHLDALLKSQGLGLGDIVQMECFVAGDPAKGGKMDFDGLNAAYAKFFGTADQPNRPVRSAVQVAGLAVAGGLVEIQVTAVRAAK